MSTEQFGFLVAILVVLQTAAGIWLKSTIEGAVKHRFDRDLENFKYEIRQKEPKNFFDLFFESEARKLLSSMHSAGVTQSSELADLPRMAKIRMPLKFYFERLRMNAAEGLQLGSHYPDIAEKLLSYKYDPEEWRFFYEAGLDTDAAPPKHVPLPEREADIKSLIRPYVEEVHPELLAELEL